MKHFESFEEMMEWACSFTYKPFFEDANFCGTTCYNKVGDTMLLTDGAMHTTELMPEAVLGSVLHTIVGAIETDRKTEGFFHLQVLQGSDPRTILVLASDGNYNLLGRYELQCDSKLLSDAELTLPYSFEYYAVEQDEYYVLMLKSEY